MARDITRITKDTAAELARLKDAAADPAGKVKLVVMFKDGPVEIPITSEPETVIVDDGAGMTAIRTVGLSVPVEPRGEAETAEDYARRLARAYADLDSSAALRRGLQETVAETAADMVADQISARVEGGHSSAGNPGYVASNIEQLRLEAAAVWKVNRTLSKSAVAKLAVDRVALKADEDTRRGYAETLRKLLHKP